MMNNCGAIVILKINAFLLKMDDIFIVIFTIKKQNLKAELVCFTPCHQVIQSLNASKSFGV